MSELVIVTGASQGLGRAIVDAFASDDQVNRTFVLLARNEGRLQEVATSLGGGK